MAAKNHENDFPLTRFDPGSIPDPPPEFTISEASWFWKIASWCQVRTALTVDVELVEDVSRLLALHEETGSDQALVNANLKLRRAGFCEVDLQHLGIEIHETFSMK